MPLIRYTYPPDVRRFGDQPVLVEDVEARVLCDDMRRAVRVTEDDLAELPKAKLAEVAEQVGADVKSRDSKGHFVKKITEAQEPE
jgi:uncharacterized protein YdbL (DUF1318 family)